MIHTASTPYLLFYKRVAQTISEVIQQQEIQILENCDIKKDIILTLVTDRAAYLIRAETEFKKVFSNLLHALHRMIENIRDSYPEFDSLILNIILKTNQRVLSILPRNS